MLVSVYRMRVDSCNRLWLLDAGISRSLEDYERTCPPKILVIDLNTDTVVRRIDFPKGILRGESLFTNLVIDETTSQSASCDDVFVYITDTVEPGESRHSLSSLPSTQLYFIHLFVRYYCLRQWLGSHLASQPPRHVPRSRL